MAKGFGTYFGQRNTIRTMLTALKKTRVPSLILWYRMAKRKNALQADCKRYTRVSEWRRPGKTKLNGSRQQSIACGGKISSIFSAHERPTHARRKRALLLSAVAKRLTFSEARGIKGCAWSIDSDISQGDGGQSAVAPPPATYPPIYSLYLLSLSSIVQPWSTPTSTPRANA